MQLTVAVSAGIFAIVIVASLIWLLFGPEPRLSRSMDVAAAVLVVGSILPLAFAINHLITITSVKRISEHGTALPDPALLESLARASYIIFRKSGILTHGRPTITETDVLPNPHTPVTKELLLQIVASLQRGLGHPWAHAVLVEAGRQQVVLTEARHLRTIPGRGMEGVIAGRRIHIGNRLFMEEKLIRLDALQEASAALQQQGKTTAYVALEGEFIGLIASSDNIRSDAAALVSGFSDLGIATALATTDHRRTANAIADQLGIERVWAEISLQQKAEEIKKLQQGGHTVVLVARPGLESSSADVTVLVGPSVGSVLTPHHVMAVEEVGSIGKLIVWARKLAAIRRSNLMVAAIFSATSIPFATGLLYPFFGVVLSLPVAIMTVALAALIMGLNSLRLQSVRI